MSMTQPATSSLEERRSRLERRANVIRSRLMRTIDALDTRRHQVTALSQHAKRLAVPVVATIAGVAIVAFAATVAVARYVKHRRERTLSRRASKLLSSFRPPEPRPPIWEDALRKLTVTLVSIVASEFGKRSVKNLLDGRVPSGRLLVSRNDETGRETALVTR
jgi:hypothetical protein